MTIRIRDVGKRFGSHTALDAVSLEIPNGELVALLGPSGSGKTTLLRVIAGLETPDHGAVFLHGQDATNRPARDRQVGFVFQHYALFRHMTVFENVAFGLEIKSRAIRLPKREIAARVHELLRLTQIEALADRLPSQLSGGQRQRVALARALAIEPRLLLLDEPFGALDAKVRKELRQRLRRLHDELGITTVFVTHDQDEAMEVADRVVVMNEGRIEQIGSPNELYQSPATPFVYTFLGNVNLFHGSASAGRVRIGDAVLAAPELAGAATGDGPVIVYVRSDEFDVHRNGTHRNEVPEWSIPAVIERVRVLGQTAYLQLRRVPDGWPFEAELARDCLGEQVERETTILLAPRRFRIFHG